MLSAQLSVPLMMGLSILKINWLCLSCRWQQYIVYANFNCNKQNLQANISMDQAYDLKI